MRDELISIPRLQDFGSVSAETPASGLHRMPEAQPPVVVAWLRRMRAGALIGVAGYLYYLGYVTWFLPKWTYGRVSAPLLIMVVMLSIDFSTKWLLTSPEPGRRYWLWYLRWPIRITVSYGVALFVLTILCSVVYGVPLDSLWNTRSLDTVLGVALVFAPPIFWLSYLSRLSDRVSDSG